MKTIIRVFRHALKKFNADRSPLLASALIQAVVFSMFPLILGLISFSLFILGSSESFMDALMPFLKQVFPVGIEDIIASISAIKQTSIVIAIIGVLAFLWGTAGIFRNLESTLNIIWKVKKDRPFFRRSLLTIGSAFIVFVALLASFGLTIVINALGGSHILLFMRSYNIVFSIVLSIVLFSFIYWRFPNRNVEFMAAAFGALFTALAWEVAKHFFSFYVTQLVDFTKIYGPLSVFFLLFLWLFYAAYIFIFGAELTYVYAHRKELQ